MKKEDLYVGMRVRDICSTHCVYDMPGTIISTECLEATYDCLVEFDEDVQGHSGLGWGTVEGRHGHCFWLDAEQLEELKEAPLTPETYNIDYDSLFNL